MILEILDFFIHLDTHLDFIISSYGTLTYLILFLIIFFETGAVITPFLPGDSLLFIAGTFASRGTLNFTFLFIILTLAAIFGDSLNYTIGNFLGKKAFRKQSKFFKKEYLEKTHQFYKKHGGKTIIIARFIPIIRTFAPFVAGIGKMNYSRFLSFNISGAILWVGLFLTAGFLFGNIPFVQKNLTWFILLIIFISILPPIIEYLKSKRKKN